MYSRKMMLAAPLATPRKLPATRKPNDCTLDDFPSASVHFLEPGRSPVLS
jgi:hypothetical protein